MVAEEEQEVNVAELEPEISDAEETPEPEEDPVVEKPAPAAPQEEQKITLQDAAQRYVVGYQNSWWPSMSAYARNVSLPSLLTISEAKRFLKTWGAALRD